MCWHHDIEDVTLVNVDGDERLELNALNSSEVSRRLVDQGVQQFEELVVGLGHNLFVSARCHQRRLSVTRPDHLDTQQPDLNQMASSQNVLKSNF